MHLPSAHAVVIGITQYQRLPPLPRVADADDIASLLCDPTACGYPTANVVLLQEADASRSGVLDALDQLAHRAGADSTVLIFFSGHGGRLTSGDESYLMPIDADRSSPTGWRRLRSPVECLAKNWPQSPRPGC